MPVALPKKSGALGEGGWQIFERERGSHAEGVGPLSLALSAMLCVFWQVLLSM